MSRFPTNSDINQAAQPPKIARGMKFRIYEEEVLSCVCSENKGAGPLHCYRAADLRLCLSMTRLICF